ncbi:MAG TPA: hypothetical protein VHX65_14210 [Pirellulales bacterium]|nr:hypothetical protein [Pirellulales bacterium]
MVSVVRSLRDRQRAKFLDDDGQILSFHVFHREDERRARLERIENRHDIRVLQARGSTDFLLKPLPSGGPIGFRLSDDFQSFFSIEQQISGQINATHASTTKVSDQAVIRMIEQFRRKFSRRIHIHGIIVFPRCGNRKRRNGGYRVRGGTAAQRRTFLGAARGNRRLDSRRRTAFHIARVTRAHVLKKLIRRGPNDDVATARATHHVPADDVSVLRLKLA